MDQYDEDLTQNPFYCSLKSNHQELFENVEEQRWTICIPHIGSLSDLEVTLEDFENHILIRQEDDLTSYQTASKKNVTVKSGVITTDVGFNEQKSVAILFEETFFNKKDESYRVLCINQPLDGADSDVEDASDRSLYGFASRSAEECANLLWGTTGNKKTRKQLGDVIDTFLKRLNSIENIPLKQLLVIVKTFFDKAMNIVMKDPHMKKTSFHGQVFMDSVKLAVETHLMYGVHKRLFRIICTCLSRKDAHLNKLTRNLSHIQLQDLGVRMEFCQSVPRARKELSNLTLHRTPIGKLNCLKRVIAALVHPSQHNKITGPIPLTTDDLLPILVFLVLKADIPNWWSHMEHMSAFRFSRSGLDDEYGFYLATLEAALEHLASGQLLDIECSHHLHQQPSPQYGDVQEKTLWHKQDQDNKAIDQLFQFIKENNQPAVLEILRLSKSRRSHSLKGAPLSPLSLCHPLCSCDKCKAVQLANERQGLSHVTTESRDSKGFTALHVAAFYGHVEMVDVILKHGGLVDSADYLNHTPLHIACKRGHQAITLLLLHHNAKVNIKDGEGFTALHLAALRGHDDCAKAIVFFDQGTGGLDINVTNDFGDTALHLATRWGYYPLICFLLDNGASALVKNRKHLEPIRYAHSEDITKRLSQTMAEQLLVLKKLACFKKSESLQMIPQSPRGYATLPPKAPGMTLPPKVRGMTRSYSELSASQSSVKPPPKGDLLFSQTTNKPRRFSIISEQSETGGSLPGQKIDKLLKSAADGDINMVRYHLGWSNDSDDEDDDIDLSKQELCHPLCQCDKCQPVQKFTTPSPKSCIHVNSQDLHGYTALHIAAHNGHVTLMETLLKRGANPKLHTRGQEMSPLHLACKQRKTQVLQSLILHGAEVNSPDCDGNTPLHYCCMLGNERKTEVLVQHGAHVNLANKKGNTPLHDAVKWNFIGVARLLVKAGAFCQCRNRDHKLPIHYAQTEKMCKLLRVNVPNNIHNRRASDSQLFKSKTENQRNSLVLTINRMNSTPATQSCPSSVSVSDGTDQLQDCLPFSQKILVQKEQSFDNNGPKILSTATNKAFTEIEIDENHVPNTDIEITHQSCLFNKPSDRASEHIDAIKSDTSSAKLCHLESSTSECTEFDGLTIIDDYFEHKPHICHQKHNSSYSCHDSDHHESDCGSENSNTESQQDLMVD